MVIINTSLPQPRPVTPEKPKPTENTARAIPDSPAPESKISETAKLLSSLYENASKFVVAEHLEPFSKYVNGQGAAEAYINVGRYNHYVFDKAASSMIEQAAKQGITLDKKDVIAQLKADNTEIAEMKLDNQQRISRLGENSVLTHLSEDEMNALTDLYISARENGLDLFQVDVLATHKGIQKYYGAALGEGDIIPGAPNEQNPISPSTLEKAEEIRGKIQGNLGLGDDFVNYMLNPKVALRGASEVFLDFFSRLIDLQNQRNAQP